MDTTRRSFIRGIASAGASTAAAVALERTGYLDTATALAQGAGPSNFSEFRALAASAADAFEVPEGYAAKVVIGYGDEFANQDGTVLTYGYNNDFLAYFPLKGSDEGLLFINHEYPAAFFQHGQTSAAAKTAEQIALEQGSVGNSILHVRRGEDGSWAVVSPSIYNRRITGAGPHLEFTGPLAENPAYPGIGETATGSLANCSGGITPWGTALSCEENYQDYFANYGWNPARTGTNDYFNGNGSDAAAQPAKYGWVCEHDPFDPSFVGRKHTALGRFRHENTAFRALAGKPFVLYMGDDVNNGGVYKFVSELPYRPGRRSENLEILTRGKLYIARWEPQSRRAYDAQGNLVSPTSGTGYWREVSEAELVDTQARIMAAEGAAFLQHFATNRPEDVEVDEDGTVYIALTNNTSAGGPNDVHGSIRRMREAGNDPTAVGAGALFAWEDFAAGGPSGRPDPGEQGFSSPDNLVFDKAGNLWVVTDISSSTLNVSGRPQAFHGNNAVFMVPRTGPNAGVAFRFANMPAEAEGTGPYFTPDEQTLFVNVQHPGEETPNKGGKRDDPSTFTSYWPKGNKTTGQNPSAPIPSLVAITKLPEDETPPPGSNVIPTPPAPPAPGAPGAGPDGAGPRLSLVSPARQSLGALRGNGMAFKLEVDEPATLTLTLYGQLSTRRGRRAKARRLARVTQRVTAPGEVTIRLRPAATLRVLLRRETAVPASLAVLAVDAAGNRTTRTKRISFRR